MPEQPERDEAATPETSSGAGDDALTPMGPAARSAGEGVPFSPGLVLAERYWIQRLLGRGGMGEVWQALDLKLRVDVALKSLHPRFYEDERRRELLRQEVRTAREVISPNVCRVFDLVEVGGSELLSMEHIDGETLLSLLKERAPLPLSEARDLALQFLAGLEAVHGAGLVHRDFKPENVMITRSGRVVVMDFGIAQKTEKADGTIAGTPAYMAPEQSRGEAVDPRADLYAAGVVLAEMVSETGVRDHGSRSSVWAGIREDPPRIPESPWSPVIRKAVARDPEQRPSSAQALIRSLEEITLRVEGAEEKHPYPGLSCFTEQDADHFFGREPEVESMVRRLRRASLVALVGPSGAGKSSFLRAGLVPALPAGWGHLYCQPGEHPFAAMAASLTAARSEGEAGAVQATPANPHDPEAVIAAARRWRAGHEDALLILDQFEELFTLSGPEVQARFAELVGRLSADAGVRVLVSIRDDFLFQCHAHAALAPLFSELVPLGPPTGAALNRALVQPALALGYRFEDESLVGEMLEEVSRERGALPLLAFAAAGLWERRDRDEGLLTRKAYEAIGGVGGALAQHAEATLERIGLEREPVVRELFRNLVTAHGTRAIRDRAELLSVFDDTSSAEEVLGELIAARLLTSFEAPGLARSTAPDGGASPEGTIRRIEVIHESLLSAWPRLVRWRTQDAEGAQLRDQLRQAAGLWDERGRPEELLWTGASYLEYRAWRERYPGGLTDTEAAFGRAMEAFANRRRRRRRMIAGAAFALLVAALATFGALWRDAADEARRATASKLLALGRLEMNDDPTAALAYALRSLELHDDPVARRFALEVLWKGPTRIVVSPTLSGGPFSPDGRWLARWGIGDGSDLELYAPDGRIQARAPAGSVGFSKFSPDSRTLVVMKPPFTKLQLFAIPDLSTREMSFDAPTAAFFGGAELFTATLRGPAEGGQRLELQRWAGDGGGGPRPRGTLVAGGRLPFWAIHPDPAHDRVAFGRGRDVFLAPLDPESRLPPRRIGGLEHSVTSVRLSPDGRWLASGDSTGEVQLFSTERVGTPIRTVAGPSPSMLIRFSQDGSWLSLGGGETTIGLLDLSAPPDAEPLVLRFGEKVGSFYGFFHPNGHWLTTGGSTTNIWPLVHRYPSVLRGHRGAVQTVAFAPDGSWLASGGFRDGNVRVWPLGPDAPARSRVVFAGGANDPVWDVAVSPDGRQLLVGQGSGRVHVVPLDGGPARLLEGRKGQAMTVAFGPRGRLVAAAGGQWIPKERVINVWDLESGRMRVLDAGDGHFIRQIRFLRDGRLLPATDAGGGLRLWDVEHERSRLLREGTCKFAVSPDERSVYTGCWEGKRHWIDEAAEGQEGETLPLVRIDLATGTSEQLGQHVQSGELAVPMTIDPSGTHLVTGSSNGPIRVRPLAAGPEHLLLGHEEGMVWKVAVSPDGRLIASAGQDGTVRVWPMPEGPPFHKLRYHELLARIRQLTNVRVVDDPASTTGYSVKAGPFPGWETVPTW
jgi:WD40 repeat protein